MSTFIEPIASGFMLGLTAGPFCLTGCFPVLLSVTLAQGRENTASRTWLFVGEFIGGRFIAYLAFGFFIGLLGSHIGGFSYKVGIYALIILSVILIAYGLGARLPRVGMCEIAGRTAGKKFFPFILGGLTGLNVCPPFLLAVTYILQRAITPAFGIFFFMSFFTASTLYILPVGLTGHLSHRELIARVGRVAAVVVGVVFLYRGVSALMVS